MIKIAATLGAIVMALTSGISSSSADEVIKYGVAKWPEDRGNVRALVKVSEKADAVKVTIPWRRRDRDPDKKDIRVFDTAGKQITNVSRQNVTRELGELVFEPSSGPGVYEIYYMPYQAPEGNFGQPGTYFESKDTADPNWVSSKVEGWWESLPEAEVVELQSRGEFNSFYPMEAPATASEMQTFLKAHRDKPYLIFPENRKYPIKMMDELPLKWIKSGQSAEFSGKAQPNEYYTFQLGVYAAGSRIDDLTLKFSDFKSASGKTIPASAVNCINLSGTNWVGKPFTKTFTVDKGLVRALWIGVQVPKDASGTYEGTVKVTPKDSKPSIIKVKLNIAGEVLADHGDSELWRHSRLRWLDSTKALDDEIVPPFTPLQVSGNKIGMLIRDIEFNSFGLPGSIKANGREILSKPVDWVVETSAGRIQWTDSKTRTTKKTPGTVVRETVSTGGQFKAKCISKTEFDGCITYSVTLTAQSDADIKDIRLEIPYVKDVAKYLMGFGIEGGYRRGDVDWKWKIDHADQMLWMGDFDAGLQCKLKDTKDTWEIIDLKDSGLPKSWNNDGRGGATVREENGTVLFKAYSGERKLKAGESILFRFRFLVTPFREIDPEHWNWRYGSPQQGGNIVHIHHSSPGNPYINYPFIDADKLTTDVDSLHKQGLKMTLYYTVRELSNYATEMWALRSLGNEIFTNTEGFSYFDNIAVINKSGGGYPWLQEHLQSGYVPAWRQPLGDGVVDAAIATTGLSRWHNYYVEGMEWLMKNVRIDGLYLDGIGYDREIMKRIRKVMLRTDPMSLAKFHSGNNYAYMDIKVSPMNQYMEHLPYMSDLWIGEMYDYDKFPDYWLIEMSGIPFGLTNEMLNYENGGNPYRGMLYGMTGRQNVSYPAMLKFWDSFGIQQTEMIGYWDPKCPVKTGREDILATAYKKDGKTLIAIASWAKEKADVDLQIDWKALGIDPEKVQLSAPKIEAFQEQAEFSLGQKIPVEPGKGVLIVVSEKR